MRKYMRKKAKTTALMTALIMIVGIFAGCTTYDNFKEAFLGDSSGRDTVKIGVFEPSTGEFKEEGELETRGMELANKLYPEVLGKKVELIYADTGSDLNVAKTAAKDLVANEPSVILGSYGSVFSMLGGSYFEKKNIPAIAVTNTNPLVTSEKDNYFRVCFVESDQGTALADFTAESLKNEKAAVMMPKDDDQAMEVSRKYSDRMIKLTEDEDAVLSYQEYSPGDVDFGRQLYRIKETGARVVFLPGAANDSLNIIRQARDLSYPFIFLGTELWQDEDFIKEIKDRKEKEVFWSAVFDADARQTEMTGVFLEAYRKEYGKSAPKEATALGFDAYLLALNAIEKAGDPQNGRKISEALRNNKNFEGASGFITFDQKGDPERSVNINGLSEGKVTAVYVAKPASVIKAEKEKEKKEKEKEKRDKDKEKEKD